MDPNSNQTSGEQPATPPAASPSPAPSNDMPPASGQQMPPMGGASPAPNKAKMLIMVGVIVVALLAAIAYLMMS